MSRLRVAYSAGYTVPLPEGHRFPMGKFLALKQILERDGIIGPNDIVEPEEAPWEDLALVHTPEYLHKLRHGALGRAEERRLGLPLTLLLSGGYAATPRQTAELHAIAHRTAREIEGRRHERNGMRAMA